MSQNVSLGSLPNLSVYGLTVNWASTTTLTMASGQARDSNNAVDLVLANSVTINGAVNGANGLDTGSLANSTWYYVYLIGSSINTQPTAALLSTSTTPALPMGYDSYRRVACVLTDVSSQFVKFYSYGNGSLRKYFWDAPIGVLSSQGSTSYQAVPCTSAMAPTARIVRINSQFIPNSAGNTFKLRTTGSSSTTNLTGSGVATTVSTFAAFEINTNANNAFDFITQNASDLLALSATGFDDFI